LEDNNYIFDELKSEGKGIQGEENKLFRELLNFEKNERNKSLPVLNSIINFFPAGSDFKENKQLPVKLAAQSNSKSKLNKADFLVSEDGNFLIKISKKTGEEVHLSLISENDSNIEDAILFSQELNKYFISNLSNEYVIGQYSSFDLNALNFKAVFPFEKTVLAQKNNSYSTISLNNFSNPEIKEITSSFILLNPKAERNIINAVLISSKSKDFLEIKNGLIEIPLILISEKAYILLY